MFDVNKADWGKIKNPNDLFTLFEPDPQNPIEFEKKIVRFERYLKDKYLYLSDQYRHPGTIRKLLMNYFSNQVFNIFYELGDFQGLVGFTNIIPGFKSGVILKIWDKEAWTKENARKMNELAEIVMSELQLIRIGIQTPDRRMVKFGRLFGFQKEGEKEKDFRWNNRLYTTYMLARIKGRDGDDKPKSKQPNKPKKKTNEKAKTTTKKKSKKTTATKKKNTKKEPKKVAKNEEEN